MANPFGRAVSLRFKPSAFRGDSGRERFPGSPPEKRYSLSRGETNDNYAAGVSILINVATRVATVAMWLIGASSAAIAD